MKKLWKLFLPLLAGILAVAGCAKAPYEQVDVTMSELQEMVDSQEDFVLLVERDNCPFCEALNEYIETSKDEHPGVKVYVLDITSMELKKPTEDAKTLVSETEDGQALLQLVPYFYYTPTIYRFEDGRAVEAGLGYNVNTYEISLWDTETSADLDSAETENVWTFITQSES